MRTEKQWREWRPSHPDDALHGVLDDGGMVVGYAPGRRTVTLDQAVTGVEVASGWPGIEEACSR